MFGAGDSKATEAGFVFATGLAASETPVFSATSGAVELTDVILLPGIVKETNSRGGSLGDLKMSAEIQRDQKLLHKSNVRTTDLENTIG